MSALDYCSTCKGTKAIPCPCGDAACIVTTYVSFCPKCDPKKADGYRYSMGIKVCEAHVKKQLGM